MFAECKGSKDFPDASTFTYMWTAVEDYLLEACIGYMAKLRPSHLSLHFDGLRVSKSVAPSAENV